MDVFIKDETLWLAQKALAELFGVQMPGINKHIRNISESGELEGSSVVSILETTSANEMTCDIAYYKPDLKSPSHAPQGKEPRFGNRGNPSQQAPSPEIPANADVISKSRFLSGPCPGYGTFRQGNGNDQRRLSQKAARPDQKSAHRDGERSWENNGGQGWIRTSVLNESRFTVCRL